MRVVIAGGGTGGHVFPGMAVAEVLRTSDPSAEVVFIGTERGIESRVLPKAGYQIRFIQAEGFIGKSLLKRASALVKLFLSLFASRRILKALCPDIVIGTGGYVSMGPVLAASLMSIPTLIIEHNLVPGLANKMLGKFVDAVAVTYHESINFFPKDKTHLTGTPIRPGVLGADRSSSYGVFGLDEGRFTVFITGGSSGSRSMNNAVISALSYLAGLKENMQFLHQTGEADFEAVKKTMRKHGMSGVVAPFIYRMAEAYAVADLVISRAGATTIAELAALGKPSILVPYPHAARHQEFNAERLARLGAAIMMRQEELTGEALAGKIKEIFLSAEKRAEMRKQCLSIGRPDAAERVADIARSLVNLRKGAKCSSATG